MRAHRRPVPGHRQALLQPAAALGDTGGGPLTREASMIPNIEFDTEDLQAKDNRWIHPWEEIAGLGRQKRTVITSGEGIYVTDSDGNRMIDGPAGMWCVNVGHGRREIADAIAEQALRLSYYSPWSVTNAPAVELAAKLTSIAPDGFGHVFFTTGGSTAVDSALRFAI